MSDTEPTRHARKRLKERMGLSKSAHQKIVKLALTKGIGREDATGKLKRYLDYVFFRYSNAPNIRIFAEKVFVFNNELLITVFPIDPAMKVLAQRQLKEKSGRDNSKK